jgi:hypothetical protein
MPRARACASIPADWSAPTTRCPAAATIEKYLPVLQGASTITLPVGQVPRTRLTDSRWSQQDRCCRRRRGLRVVARDDLRAPHVEPGPPIHTAPLQRVRITPANPARGGTHPARPYRRSGPAPGRYTGKETKPRPHGVRSTAPRRTCVAPLVMKNVTPDGYRTSDGASRNSSAMFTMTQCCSN